MWQLTNTLLTLFHVQCSCQYCDILPHTLTRQQPRFGSTNSHYTAYRSLRPLPLMSSASSDEPPSPAVDLLAPTMRITASGAELAMAGAEAEASANGWDVTICISDAGGVPVLAKRCNNAFAASYEIAVGKAKSAALFAKKTSLLESVANVSEGSGRAAMLSAPFVLMGGGIPFIVNGVCCGAVGVSGVKPDQDEKIANAAINALESSLSKL